MNHYLGSRGRNFLILLQRKEKDSSPYLKIAVQRKNYMKEIFD